MMGNWLRLFSAKRHAARSQNTAMNLVDLLEAGLASLRSHGNCFCDVVYDDTNSIMAL